MRDAPEEKSSLIVMLINLNLWLPWPKDEREKSFENWLLSGADFFST